ncbi:MAG: hypothetical protein AAGF85_00585 [Bacteroidota bacterium]
MILKVPVRPHVKQFLLHRYPQPFPLTETDQIGDYLYMLLRRHPMTDNKHSFHFSNYCDVLEVSIANPRVFDRGAIAMTPTTTVKFNQYVDNFMKECLVEQLDLLEETGGMTWKKCIYRFMDRNGILEGRGATYENFKKYYYRLRKKRACLQLSA